MAEGGAPNNRPIVVENSKVSIFFTFCTTMQYPSRGRQRGQFILFLPFFFFLQSHKAQMNLIERFDRRYARNNLREENSLWVNFFQKAHDMGYITEEEFKTFNFDENGHTNGSRVHEANPEWRKEMLVELKKWSKHLHKAYRMGYIDDREFLEKKLSRNSTREVMGLLPVSHRLQFVEGATLEDLFEYTQVRKLMEDILGEFSVSFSTR
jgi:hypothetical protein